jgi:hypothetical protein
LISEQIELRSQKYDTDYRKSFWPQVLFHRLSADSTVHEANILTSDEIAKSSYDQEQSETQAQVKHEADKVDKRLDILLINQEQMMGKIMQT